jgi:hypothetical protein
MSVKTAANAETFYIFGRLRESKWWVNSTTHPQNVSVGIVVSPVALQIIEYSLPSRKTPGRFASRR